MHCLYHEREAVATCSTCGKGVCNQCLIELEHNMLCPECFLVIIKKQKSVYDKINRCLILGLILGMISFALLYYFNKFSTGLRALISIVIITYPLASYLYFNRNDPYVQLSKNAGFIPIYNSLIYNIITGPIYSLFAIAGQGKRKKAIKTNIRVYKNATKK